MKSNRKKRILAAILCMVMVLSSNISALAEGEILTDPNAVAEAETPEAVSVTEQESAEQEPTAEEPPVTIEQTEPETPAENTEVTAPEASTENTEPTAPEASTENTEPTAPETSTENTEPTAPETSTENTEPTVPETSTESTEPTAPEVPAEETPVFSEETELTKELWDASGKLVQKVTAKLPKGAFEAETSQIEMEVTYVDSSMENYIKGMMEKKLPTDNTLGDYFLYNIQFKVNGEAKESLEPITITFEKSNLEIKDTKKANVFFFDPANPEVSGDKDELVEITQRSELLESLQAAGQSTATMEEDYDLSSIEIKEENRSGKIVLEGRKSTIYGCYVEKEPEQIPETPAEQPEEKPADEEREIEIVSKETKLYTSPMEKEENVVAIVTKGERFKVITNVYVGEETWYEIAYIKPGTEEQIEVYVNGASVKLVGELQEEVLPVVFEKELEGLKVVVTAKDNTVLPEDAVLSVEKIEDAKEVEDIKDTLAPELVKEETTIKDMIALDIKFFTMENGEQKEIQPNGEVQVEIKNTNLEVQNNLSVYHVDEKQKEATNMEATEGEKIEDVAFNTTHFSKYVVINKGSNKVQITIKHYLMSNPIENSTPLYRDKIVELAVYDEVDENKLTDFTAEDDQFSLKKIVKKIGENPSEEITPGENEQDVNIIVDEEATIMCYYEPTSGTFTNGVTFFDYDIKGKEKVTDTLETNHNYNITIDNQEREVTYKKENNKEYFSYWDFFRERKIDLNEGTKFIYNNKECTWIGNGNYSYEVTSSSGGINSDSNYPEGSDSDNRIQVGQGKPDYSYYVEVVDPYGKGSLGSYNINVNTTDENRAPSNRVPIKPGIVNGLSSDYQNVLFAPDEPGLFSQESKSGKRILDDYSLRFVRGGNTYRLSSVYKGETKVEDAGNNFWPLDNDLGADGKNSGSDDNNEHNWYFGMRYDFTFELSDYVGDLLYKFNGDDDLWVLLDGKPIIDLGGMHSGYPDNEFEYNYQPWLDEYPNEVDLWKVLLEKENYSLEDKNTYLDSQSQVEHTITVLFMERGGMGSNCEMEFVMPNVTPKDPIISTTPKADLTFTKQDIGTKTGIPGAVFTLYRDETCETILKEATSNQNGTVSFTGLKAGTYYMKETTPADGYLPNGKIYTVKVTENGTSATAVLQYDNTEIDVIYNQRIDTAVSVGKTARVKDWDERTYNITLSAESHMQNLEEAEPVEVVLVFDRSGSMKFRSHLIYHGYTMPRSLDKEKVYYTIDDRKQATVRRVWYANRKWNTCDDSYWDYSRGSILPEYSGKIEQLDSGKEYNFYITNDTHDRLYYLKQAANTFADELAKISPQSKLSLVTFSKEVRTDFDLQEIGNNIGDFKSTINNLTTEGGTNQSLGLERAQSILETAGDRNKKQFVILLTDGCPSDCEYEDIEISAQKITNKRTLMTVAVGLEGLNQSDIVNARNVLNNIASSDSNGNKYYYSTADASELTGIFESILGTVVSNIPVENAVVKDYIDPRFEVDAASVESAGGKVGKDANGTYVIWDDVTVPAKPGWSKTITVRAKEQFIGGNDVTTNGSASGVYVGEAYKPFGQPKVNVKADILVKNKEVTIYYGDIVPTEESILKQLFNPEKPTGFVQTNGNEKEVIYTLGRDGKNIKTSDFTLEWYEDESCTKSISQDQMSKTIPEPEEKTYYLKVTYNALGDASVESKANTDNRVATGIAHNKEVDRTREYGVYKINIISGEIKISKTLKNPATQDEIFNFDVYKVNKEGTEELVTSVPITIKKGATSAQYQATENNPLSGLKRGTYIVKEADNAGFDVQNIQILDDTNCYSQLESDQARFELGNSSNQENVINADYSYAAEDGGVLGVVSFTNEKIMKNWQIVKRSTSDPSFYLSGAEFKLTPAETNISKKIYVGVSDKQGVVVWYETDEKGNKTDEVATKIVSGKYTLSETKAPGGYIVSKKTWEIEVSAKGYLINITGAGEPDLLSGESGTTSYTFYFDNTPLYELPSTGGPGIFVYTIGGTLLLMAAALLIYKMKREEVLKG